MATPLFPMQLNRVPAAVVGTKPVEKIGSIPVPYLQVEDSRGALAHLSEVFYDFPADELTLIGVTGSDGKTSTVNMLYQILKAAGIKVGDGVYSECRNWRPRVGYRAACHYP